MRLEPVDRKTNSTLIICEKDVKKNIGAYVSQNFKSRYHVNKVAVKLNSSDWNYKEEFQIFRQCIVKKLYCSLIMTIAKLIVFLKGNETLERVQRRRFGLLPHLRRLKHIGKLRKKFQL